MEPAIQIEGISKAYGNVQALDDIDLTIYRGEFFGLLGPNGAGKTTLIGILGSLVRSDRGSITVLGDDITAAPKRVKRRIGIVPQEISLDPFLSVRDTLRIQSGYFGIPRNEDMIDEVLDALGLRNKEDASPRTLSGGMRRRLLIAKALIHDPEIVVLDEPTAGVDIELRTSLWQYVRRLNERGKTIILTTHYLEEAEQLCSRIAILNHGRTAAVDTKDNLMNRINRKILRLYHDRPLPPLPHGCCWNHRHSESARGGIRSDFELPREDIDGFIRFLAGTDVLIRDMELMSPKLEEIFMELVSEGSARR
ncbi:MAG: ABC transporter ATP-binding protein [Fibrobacterota bacterium]